VVVVVVLISGLVMAIRAVVVLLPLRVVVVVLGLLLSAGLLLALFLNVLLNT